MRSVVVVLPASMCAMMPIFLQRSNGTVLATAFCSSFWGSENQPSRYWLPPVMCKRLVGFRHAVNVFLLLDRGAAVVGGVEQFIAQLVDHALLAASSGVGNQPADSQRGAPVGIHFHRNLVVGAPHAAGLHFEQGLRVLHRLLEQLQRLVAALLLQAGQGLIEDALRRAFLALPHHGVDELGHKVRSVYRIGFHSPLRDMSFSRHLAFRSWLLAFGSRGSVNHRWQMTTSAASLRTSSGSACGWQHPPHPASRAPRDSARPANPSRGPRG